MKELVTTDMVPLEELDCCGVLCSLVGHGCDALGQ
jgi:hypothetical protein